MEENGKGAGSSPVEPIEYIEQVNILTDLKVIFKIIWGFSGQPCLDLPIIETCQSLLAWESIKTCPCAPAVQARWSWCDLPLLSDY